MQINNFIDDLSQAKKSKDWTKCIQICREALNELPKENIEDVYAFKIYLAFSLFMSQSKENLEAAIRIYKNLLKKTSMKGDAKQKGSLYRSLGRAYQERMVGDRKNNLSLAIKFLQKSLNFYRLIRFIALARREHNFVSRRDRAVKRICQNFYSYKNRPEDWGSIKAMIGLSFAELSEGTDKENLQKALRSYQEAVRAINPETDKERWEEIVDGINELKTSLNAIRKERLAD